MAAPVILIEAQPRLAADGSLQTVRLAGGGASKPYYYLGNHWRAGLTGLPTFIASLDFSGDDLGTGGVPQAAEIVWGPTLKSDLATIANYFWADAAITVRIGPEGSVPVVVLQGKVLEATVESGKLRIALADPAADLKKPLLSVRYAGTGGLEGPAEWDALIKRRVWGRVWNLKGDPIDKANNIYCFADPLQPLQEITTVRDKGAPAASLTLLAWAGSAAATLTALQAASAPAGGGVVCPSIACVKWWTQPAGDLNADIKGEIGSGYVETTAEIVARLVQLIGGPAFASGTLATAISARPAPVGWVAKDEVATVAAMLDELLGNSSLLWLLDGSGQIVLREWAWGASAASARSHGVSRKAAYRPAATRKIGYRRNESPMARGDLAAIVLSSEVAYLDGTPVEALKPAQAGADKTSTNTAANTAAVGSITAGSVSTTINSGGGVATNQVATVSMLANAASKEAYVNTGFFYLTTGTPVTCASMTYVKDDAATALRVAVLANFVIQDNASVINRIFVDGTQVWSNVTNLNGDNTAFYVETYAAIVPGLAVGSHSIVYTAELANGAAATSYANQTFMEVRETKR